MGLEIVGVKENLKRKRKVKNETSKKRKLSDGTQKLVNEESSDDDEDDGNEYCKDPLWESGYGGFGLFRNEVANLAGLGKVWDLYTKYCFHMPGGDHKMMDELDSKKILMLHNDPKIAASSFDEVAKKHGFGKEGECAKKNPGIIPFLFHSDCEGYWTSDECRYIHDMVSSVASWDRIKSFRLSKKEGNGSIKDDEKRHGLFMKGLKWCYENKGKAIFQ